MNNLFYFFKGLFRLVFSIIKGIVNFIFYMLFPLILFLFLYFKTENYKELFEQMDVENYGLLTVIVAVIFVYIGFFAAFSFKFIAFLLSHPTALGLWSFWTDTAGSFEAAIVLFGLYIQLFVIFVITCKDLLKNSVYAYLVELGKQDKLQKR